MRILGYKGKSMTSKLIQLQTRSEYSHVAIMLDDLSVVEAWQGTGVRKDFLLTQLGKKYDYSSVFRFVTRRDALDNDRIFCSELVELAFIRGGLRLLRGNPSHHSPRDTVMCPYLKYLRTIK